MRDRNGSLLARLGSEGILEGRRLWDAPTYQIGRMRRTRRAAAVVQPNRLPPPRPRV
jgi:hypothetical protein